MFNSSVLPATTINIGGGTEQIVRGGRNLFPLLLQGFQGDKQIGIIGWGSQGSAQAPNLRDSLEGTDIKVVVGLQAGSSSFEKARKAGFTEENGTLGEMYSVISSSDLVILLISDSAQAELYKQIFAALKPGATLGLSHGFLLMHLKNVGNDFLPFPKENNIIMVAPKGMGLSVRRLYVQGKEVNGAGINSSFAVEQDVDGRATDIALAWSVGIGSPYTFQTTMRSEVISDIFGERGILLGGVWAVVEVAYRQFLESCLSPTEAFRQAVESLTGPISKTISQKGIIGLYNSLDKAGQDEFVRAYSVSYHASMPVLTEIYDEVSSGNEVRSVILAGERLKSTPMSTIGDTPMWRVGIEVRANRTDVPVNAHVAGMYAGMMMAQIDLLLSKGHPWSEVANESVIEATDSLNPYMHARGISYMVDNCSRTARLGTRRWGPAFEKALDCGFGKKEIEIDADLIEAFKTHPIHAALAVCAELRPTVDIAVE
jgi:ketol-acid reductoisomerase